MSAVWQARLHVADGAAAEGLQSLAHLMARVQRAAAAHTPPQGGAHLQTLRTHESDVSCLPLAFHILFYR